MISNRVQRNLWFTLSVITFTCMLAAAINVWMGFAEWWVLGCAAVIFGACFKFYRIYRKKVLAGYLFGGPTQ